MAKSIFERLSGEYEQQEDYLIPRLTVPAEEEHSIGIWGQQYLDYLKQCHKFLKDFTIRIAADAIRCSLSLWTSRKSHFGKDVFFPQVKLNNPFYCHFPFPSFKIKLCFYMFKNLCAFLCAFLL